MERVRVWLYRPADRDAIQLQYLDPVTRRKRTLSARTSNEALAEARRVDLEADLNAGRHRGVSRLAWPDFRQRFLEEYVAALRPNTRKGYRRTLDLFGALAGNAVLSSVNAPLVSRFAASLRGRGDCPGTISLRLQQLKTALGWGVRQGFLSAIPAFPVVKVPRKLPQPVPVELYERLAARTDDQQMRVFLACGWLAGLRLEEAFALHWEESREAPWVDFAGRRIWLPADAVKGCADQWVPLDPVLAAALEELRRDTPVETGQLNLATTAVFRFTTRKGRPISCSGVGWRIVRLARQAGVRLSMRSLRRGFVSRYAARFPAQIVQRLARHQKIETTLRHYAAIDKAVEEAVFGNADGNTAGKPVKTPAN